MMRALAGAVGFLLLLPATSAAHRLDEYLQATRLAVTPAGIAIRIDLTPGASVASEVIALIDHDRDGRITATEAHAYGRRVLREIVLLQDGRDLALTLTRVEVPAVGEMKDGVGAIHIEASAGLIDPGSGHHELFYRNNHLPMTGVYLVNALMPDTTAVSIARQRRDERQRELRLEYEVSSRVDPLAWSAGAAALLGLLALSRTRGRTHVLSPAMPRRRC